MIGSFTFENLPCRVVFGSGTLSAAAEELQRLGAKRALVLTTPQQEAQGRSAWIGARSAVCGHFFQRHNAYAGRGDRVGARAP